jgi:hypothetical protein
LALVVEMTRPSSNLTEIHKVQWGRESWPYSSWYNIYNQCLSQLIFLCYLRQVFFSLFTYSSFLQQKTDLHNITEMFLKLMLKLPIILILSQTFSSRENWVNLRSVQVIIYWLYDFYIEFWNCSDSVVYVVYHVIYHNLLKEKKLTII